MAVNDPMPAIIPHVSHATQPVSGLDQNSCISRVASTASQSVAKSSLDAGCRYVIANGRNSSSDRENFIIIIIMSLNRLMLAIMILIKIIVLNTSVN